MLYTLQCRACESVEDYNMGMYDTDLEVICEGCGLSMTRRVNRVWEPNYQIQGDTVPRGCSYDYWDGNLGVRVKSKRHRADEMKRQGLRDYSPDPELKKYRDEARYVREHAPNGDLGAYRAANSLYKEATTVRQRRNIDRVFDSAPMPDINLD